MCPKYRRYYYYYRYCIRVIVIIVTSVTISILLYVIKGTRKNEVERIKWIFL